MCGWEHNSFLPGDDVGQKFSLRMTYQFPIQSFFFEQIQMITNASLFLIILWLYATQCITYIVS